MGVQTAKTSLKTFILFFIVIPVFAQTPPVAKKLPKADSLFGDVRLDNYYWLRNAEDPEVINYLKAENAYTEAVMKPTEELQKKLYKEMRRRIKETDMSVPERMGDYYYYFKSKKGQQYEIFCRKQACRSAREEILLDENLLARGHAYFAIGVYRISPDHRLLAYTVDTSGAEIYDLTIKDLEGDSLYRETIRDIDNSIQWHNDSRTLYYVTMDPARRPYRLYRHTLAAPAQTDSLLYEETDERFFLDISKTRSQKYLIMTVASKTATECWFLDADDRQDELRRLLPRRPQVEYAVDHHGDFFYILTNDVAKNFRLVKTPVQEPRWDNLEEIIAGNDSICLEGMDAFQNFLVVYERYQGLPRLQVIDIVTKTTYYPNFPEPAFSFWPTRNPEFHTDYLRFYYTSLVTPISVYELDMKQNTLRLLKQNEVRHYEPARYATERIFVRGADHALIPVVLVYRRDRRQNSLGPVLLSAYGAYGNTNDPFFSSSRICLLDRGFLYALAQVRGGGEMGRTWYEQGKLLNKKNSFTDFIAVAEYLIQKQYTSSDQLCIEGGSAGGLLIGAVLNLRPDLFRAAIADVPFVDVLNTMLDPSIPLTVTEYEEWGNPNLREYYDYIKAYAPYENVMAKNYPNLLVTAGLNDPRVGFWEPAKWVAKLRALKTDQNLLLFKINMVAGHGGATGRYEYLKELAFEYAFLLRVLGVGG